MSALDAWYVSGMVSFVVLFVAFGRAFPSWRISFRWLLAGALATLVGAATALLITR